MRSTHLGPISKALAEMSVQCLWVMISRVLRALDGDEAVVRGERWTPAVEEVVRGLPAAIVERDRVRNYANRTPSRSLRSVFDVATEAVRPDSVPQAEVYLLDYTLRLVEALLEDPVGFQELIVWFQADVADRRTKTRDTARRVHQLLSDEVVHEPGVFMGD